jgi:hypothetical protein
MSVTLRLYMPAELLTWRELLAVESRRLVASKKTMMIFGDAKATLTSLIQLLKQTAPAQASSTK